MSDRSRSTRVAVRAAAGLAALALVGGLAGCSSEPERNDEGEIEEEGDLSAFSLQEGDCITDLASLGTTVQELPVVPCDQEHEAEIYHLFDLPDGEFPAATLDADAEEGCAAAFEDYFGEPLEGSELSVTYLAPSAESWEQGDQEVVCIAVTPAGGATDGSEVPADDTSSTEATG